MKTGKRSYSEAIAEDEILEVPMSGVLTVDFNTLSEAGIVFKYEDNKLSFWSNAECHTNKAFEIAGIKLCEAGNFDGPESHIMYDAINRAELNIRLIKVLQGGYRYPVSRCK